MQLFNTLLVVASVLSLTSAARYKPKGRCTASFVNGSCYKDTVKVDFEKYTLGSTNGQDGWTQGPGYDVNIVSTTVHGFGKKALQISNAYTTGSFGDQTYCKPLKNSVGEHSATVGTFSAGTHRYKHFEGAFDLAMVEPYNPKLDLHMNVSPDRGDGSRMSFLRFVDTPQGIVVTFDDTPAMYPKGDPNCYVGPNPPTPARYGPCAVFTDYIIATLDRKKKHRIGFYINTKEGNNNDVVKIYIDGKLVHTGTSWENYYKFDVESNAEQSVRILKTLLFRASGHAEPNHAGKGFLVDNIVLGAY